MSHNSVHALRRGTNLFEQLLTCPICYDVTKPPRITLQNVLLIGRLSIEVTTGYQKYLAWLKEYCTNLAENKATDTVYLQPDAKLGSTTTLGFKIGSDKLYELIADGLRDDARQLEDLGRRMAIRQHDRHLIGHESCPDWEGRCWKEKLDVDPDPSDICPQSPSARIFTPCYRIVDEVRSKIKLFQDAIT